MTQEEFDGLKVGTRVKLLDAPGTIVRKVKDPKTGKPEVEVKRDDGHFNFWIARPFEGFQLLEATPAPKKPAAPRRKRSSRQPR